MNCKNKSFMTKKRAFTLIELLIVIAIIGILFIVLVSKVDFATDKAKATGVQTDFRSFQVAIESVAKENAGLATFGWDTGDANGDRVRNSYDKGDTNQNGKQDSGEVFVGSKTYGETWTNIYTLTNPADADDKSAIAALETAINKNLDPKLHITINDDLTITMANGAQDPWNTEYHGYYITNAEVDKKDRGAIVIYSNGANNEFGSEHSIANGVVTVNVPGNNKFGKDDYSIAVVYTYVNGYGEVKTATTGFSNNQGGGQAGSLSNPQHIFQTNVPYVVDMDYVVFKDDGTFIVFYDEFASGIIEGGNDIALQMVDIYSSGLYEWYMDPYGIEWVRIVDSDVELEVTSLIKSDKTYHDVYQNQTYNALLMDCSKSRYYEKCQHSTTMSLTYINDEFIDDSANVFEWFENFYIYNNVVFDEYDEPVGYVSMDGQYIEIFYDCNHYFLSKRGEPSRTPDLIPVLNEHGFYENAIYEAVYSYIIFFNDGRVETNCNTYAETWVYDSDNNIIIINNEDGTEDICRILSDSQIVLGDHGYETQLTMNEESQRNGYYLEKVYVDEHDDIYVICHEDGSVTVWYWNKLQTIQTNMMSEFSRYFIVPGDCSVTFSEDGTCIDVFWYE